MANIQIRRRGGDDDNPAWQIRVRVMGRDCYRFVRGSLADAEQAAARFAEELDGQAPTYTPGMRFAAFAETWISRHLPALAGQTAGSYRNSLERHLLPAIGNKRLGQITAADGLRLQTRMLKAKFAPVTIEHALRLGRTILGEAHKFGAIPGNPWLAVKQEHRRRDRPDVLHPAKFHLIESGPRDDTSEILRLALYTGMRVGELLALRWREIDTVGFTSLEVTGSLEFVCGQINRKAPKTRSGYRRIGLIDKAGLMLRERYLRLGRPDGELPVFAAPGGGWLKPNSVVKNAGNRLRTLGLTPSIHALRHAHATYLLSSGVAPQTVAHLLGHSDIRTTIAIYGHVLPGDDARAVRALNAAFAA